MLNIKRIFETIADAGQKILEKKSLKSITKKRDLLDLCDDLLSTKGAAFGITLARDILFRYQNLSVEEKNKFLINVNEKYNIHIEAHTHRWKHTVRYKHLDNCVKTHKNTLFICLYKSLYHWIESMKKA